MGLSQSVDINIISPENSSTTPLLGNTTFTGVFVRVMDWTSVAATVSSDVSSAFEGFQLQWSFDGVNEDLSLRQSFGSGDVFADGRIRAPFFRVVYINGSIDQGFFTLTTILRRGTPSGSIISVGRDVTGGSDAQVTQSVLVAPSLADPTDLVRPRASGDPFLYVIHPPPRSTFTTQLVTATTFFSPQLDFFGIFGATRRFFTVVNDTIRGNLFIKFGSSASITVWDYKVPPQGTWSMPSAWIPYSGTIFGIWDVADGSAHVMEAF